MSKGWRGLAALFFDFKQALAGCLSLLSQSPDFLQREHLHDLSLWDKSRNTVPDGLCQGGASVTPIIE
jgi:hypothetical protein